MGFHGRNSQFVHVFLTTFSQVASTAQKTKSQSEVKQAIDRYLMYNTMYSFCGPINPYRSIIISVISSRK